MKSVPLTVWLELQISLFFILCGHEWSKRRPMRASRICWCCRLLFFDHAIPGQKKSSDRNLLKITIRHSFHNIPKLFENIAATYFLPCSLNFCWVSSVILCGSKMRQHWFGERTFLYRVSFFVPSSLNIYIHQAFDSFLVPVSTGMQFFIHWNGFM